MNPGGQRFEVACYFQFQTCQLNLNNVYFHSDMSVTKRLLLKRNFFHQP